MISLPSFKLSDKRRIHRPLPLVSALSLLEGLGTWGLTFGKVTLRVILAWVDPWRAVLRPC
jgi:hypothetical protein